MEQKRWKYCEGITHEMSIPNITLIDIFRKSADSYPERPSIYFQGKIKSYKEVEEKVNRFANSLKKLGVKKGDRVAVLMPNCPQFVISFWATLSLGAIITAISPLYTAKEIRYQLQDSEAKILISLDMFLNEIREIQHETKLEQVIISSIAEELPPITKVLYKLFIGIKNPKIKNEQRFKALVKEGKNTRIVTEMNPKEDVAVLQYTGGTTGIMKGAMLTHFNLVAQSNMIAVWDNWIVKPKEQYIMMGVLPFSHIFGLSASFLWGTITAALILLIPDARNLKNILDAINKCKPHFMNAVPILFQKLAEHPDIKKYDLSSLILCISGGEGLPQTTTQKFENVTGTVLIEGYGLSESSPVTHINPANREKRKIGSIGLPISNTLAMLVDLDTQEEIQEYGKTGELWIRSPCVMKGYWNAKEASEKVLVKGWLRTGDIATTDEEGFFRIVDRAKDMIIVSGYKVWPRDVEEVLYAHPAINMTGVIGIKDDRHSELVKAYLVAEPGHEELTLEEVREYCKKSLAAYKVPRQIEYVQDLPRTTLGKVLRKDLRKKSTEEQKTTSIPTPNRNMEIVKEK